MKTKFFHLLLFWFFLFYRADAQQALQPAFKTIVVSLPYNVIIDHYMLQGNVPHFTISALNTLFSNYGVTGFKRAYPNSRFEDMRHIYNISCNDVALAHELTTNFGQYFPRAYEQPKCVPLADYYPSDYHRPAVWPIRPDYLGYINAPTAWGITKGSSTITVGITDWYIDTLHPDLQNKIERVGNNYLDSSEATHGTWVAGIVGANTDNVIGYPSIGFKTKIDFSTDVGEAGMQDMASRNKIINGSWVWSYDGTDNLVLPAPGSDGKKVYDEIYENGTFTCFAAGNGKRGDLTTPNPWQYLYPASLDHVFSTSMVGWEGTPGVDNFNVRGVHEKTIGDTLDTHQHNTRVDILAPALRLGVVNYNPKDRNDNYRWSDGWGTSFASPIVAGTAALMLSLQHKDCLTPYQLEYLLKMSANRSVRNLPENARYAGRLGAGALDAGAAVTMAGDDHGEGSCNNPMSQTMYIAGIELNHRCAPGKASNNTNPRLSPIIVNGKPPYIYKWEPVDDGGIANGNNTTLSSYTAAEPEIISAYGTKLAWYYLTVYDGSDFQKVAQKRIKIKLTDAPAYDLAVRDSYQDMLDEPNSMTETDPRDWQIWESPDLWVRQTADSGLEPQTPEYLLATPNHVYTRVRNVGCSSFTSGAGLIANLELYWTKATMGGEKWRSDWDGTVQIGGSSGLIPLGGVVDPGLAIPSLQPGESVILGAPWHPQVPQSYSGSPKNVDVCLLARIQEYSGSTPFYAPLPLTVAERFSQSISYNVKSNNNIATRNLLVVNLDPLNRGTNGDGKRIIDVAGAGDQQAYFDLQLINDRVINKHFAGDFSALGEVELDLGELFARWQSGGSILSGNAAFTPLGENRFLWDGTGELVLEHVALDPGERFPIGVTFRLKDGVSPITSTHLIHMRQFPAGTSRDSLPYGNVSLKVEVKGEEENNPIYRGTDMGVDTHAGDERGYTVYPNPASGQLYVQRLQANGQKATIQLLDITGRILRHGTMAAGDGLIALPLTGLTNGIYMIAIKDGDRGSVYYKVVVQQ